MSIRHGTAKRISPSVQCRLLGGDCITVWVYSHAGMLTVLYVTVMFC